MINFAVSFIGGVAAFNFFPFFPFSIVAICLAATVFLFFKQHENNERIFLIIGALVKPHNCSFLRKQESRRHPCESRELSKRNWVPVFTGNSGFPPNDCGNDENRS